MKFDVVSWILNPFILMFLAVFTGMLFGKLKFGKFNFGVSGTLFTGLAIGWGALGYANQLVETGTPKAAETATKLINAGVIPKNFFSLFLILFVVAVGLLAAKDMGIVLKKYGTKFVILGFIITLLGAASTYGMTLLSKGSNPYEVSGVYTGALTSSPGLAAAIETAISHAEGKVNNFEKADLKEKELMLKEIEIDTSTIDLATYKLTKEQGEQFIQSAEGGIGLGYAIGYPFGVLIVIFAVNFFPKIFKINVEEEMKEHKAEMEAAKSASGIKIIPEVSFDLTAFAVACFFGYTLGRFKVYLGPLGYFSLGSTGGALIGSLILGYIGKIGNLHFRMDNKILGVVRRLSLAFFLAIVGLRYGFRVVDSLTGAGAYLAGVSIVVGTIAMMAGFFIGKYIFKVNWIMLSGAICGGMTSTPGLGAAIDAVGSDEPAAGYGATYPFALLGMVIFTIILHKLPM